MFRLSSRAAILVSVLAVAAVSPAAAQEWYDEEPKPYSGGQAGDRSGDDVTASLRVGIGFTADPATFLMGLGLPVHFGGGNHVTPSIELGIDEEETILAPSVNYEHHFDLSGASDDPAVHRLHPFILAGIGFAYVHKEERNKDDDEVGFLIRTGFGLEYQVADGLMLGSSLAFNVLPVETADENFYFSWQVANLRFEF